MTSEKVQLTEKELDRVAGGSMWQALLNWIIDQTKKPNTLPLGIPESKPTTPVPIQPLKLR